MCIPTNPLREQINAILLELSYEKEHHSLDCFIYKYKYIYTASGRWIEWCLLNRSRRICDQPIAVWSGTCSAIAYQRYTVAKQTWKPKPFLSLICIRNTKSNVDFVFRFITFKSGQSHYYIGLQICRNAGLKIAGHSDLGRDPAYSK